MDRTLNRKKKESQKLQKKLNFDSRKKISFCTSFRIQKKNAKMLSFFVVILLQCGKKALEELAHESKINFFCYVLALEIDSNITHTIKK